MEENIFLKKVPCGDVAISQSMESGRDKKNDRNVSYLKQSLLGAE